MYSWKTHARTTWKKAGIKASSCSQKRRSVEMDSHFPKDEEEEEREEEGEEGERVEEASPKKDGRER